MACNSLFFVTHYLPKTYHMPQIHCFIRGVTEEMQRKDA